MQVRFTTLGCRLNRAEAEEARDSALAAGHVLAGPGADLHVVHTCTVTATAAKKSRQALARARVESPEATVVATGCAVAHPASLVHALADLALPSIEQLPFWPAAGALPAPRLGAHRAFLKIQDGCDDHCTFCVIPSTRGRNRSRPLDDLVRRAKLAFATGHRELVLTGVSVGGWGTDLEPALRLPALVRALLAETDFTRMRVASVEPQDADDDVLSLWSDERVCPHVHLCLQSGSDTLLRRMGRRYTVNRYAEVVAGLRAARSGIRITTDLIAGFPGETEADHAATLDAINDLALDGAHVFPFSARAGTPAERLRHHVPTQTAARRAAELRAAGEGLAAASRARRVGGDARVLCERPVPGGWAGWSEDYLPVIVSSPEPLESRIVSVRLSVGDGDALHGEVEEVT